MMSEDRMHFVPRKSPGAPSVTVSHKFFPGMQDPMTILRSRFSDSPNSLTSTIGVHTLRLPPYPRPKRPQLRPAQAVVKFDSTTVNTSQGLSRRDHEIGLVQVLKTANVFIIHLHYGNRPSILGEAPSLRMSALIRRRSPSRLRPLIFAAPSTPEVSLRERLVSFRRHLTRENVEHPWHPLPQELDDRPILPISLEAVLQASGDTLHPPTVATRTLCHPWNPPNMPNMMYTPSGHLVPCLGNARL